MSRSCNHTLFVDYRTWRPPYRLQSLQAVRGANVPLGPGSLHAETVITVSWATALPPSCYGLHTRGEVSIAERVLYAEIMSGG